MADVRINSKRFPVLQAIDSVGTLVTRLDTLGAKEGTTLTSLSVNGSNIDLDSLETMKMKLEPRDTVVALMESAEQLALQSLQVAQEMAELLVFDLKVATINLWENTRTQQKNLETLIGDCHLFLSLGARPIDLLGRDPRTAGPAIENCLRQLDRIANNVEDAVLLAAHGRGRDACHVLVARVMPAIEGWLRLSHDFAEHLSIGDVEFNLEAPTNHPLQATLHRNS